MRASYSCFHNDLIATDERWQVDNNKPQAIPLPHTSLKSVYIPGKYYGRCSVNVTVHSGKLFRQGIRWKIMTIGVSSSECSAAAAMTITVSSSCWARMQYLAQVSQPRGRHFYQKCHISNPGGTILTKNVLFPTQGVRILIKYVLFTTQGAGCNLILIICYLAQKKKGTNCILDNI